MVTAGAGWGKTTLVASWIRAEPDRAAWFSVDATDSDPVRFWGAVIGALDGVAPGFATRSARLLGVPGTARLRGQGRVAELGTEDLRLSAAESAELLAAEATATGRRRGMRVEVAELRTALAHAEERLGRHPAAAGHRDEARQVFASCPARGTCRPTPGPNPTRRSMTVYRSAGGRPRSWRCWPRRSPPPRSASA